MTVTAAKSPPPTHPLAGSDAARQSVGLPGHCEDCAALGHVIAHPELGCADVGCDIDHGLPEPGNSAPGTAARCPGSQVPAGPSAPGNLLPDWRRQRNRNAVSSTGHSVSGRRVILVA
jgi:hypothetical protein